MSNTHHYYAHDFLDHLRRLGHADDYVELKNLEAAVDSAKKALWKRTNEIFEIRKSELAPLLRSCHQRQLREGFLRVSSTWGWC